MSLPVLGVLAGEPPPARLRELLVLVGDRCRVRDGGGAEGPAPSAYVWWADVRIPPAQRPYAAWVADLDGAQSSVANGAAALLCEDLALAERLDTRALHVPESSLPAGAVFVSPFVRRRLRQARGLPASTPVVADEHGWRWQREAPVEEALSATMAGCAPVVVASGPALLLALAWGAPTVTDPVSAHLIGARPGQHVVVEATPTARLQAARAIVADEALAGRLSWAGHVWARHTHDLNWTAAELLRRLKLPLRQLAGAHAAMVAALDELGTPPGSAVRARAASAVEALPRTLARSRG